MKKILTPEGRELKILAGPIHPPSDPYEHLHWEIIATYHHRMPKLLDLLRSDSFISAVSTYRAPFIRDPQSGQLYFHNRLIERFTTEGKGYLKLLDKAKIRPYKKKRKKSPIPISVETIKNDYGQYELWSEKNAYKTAKFEALKGGREGGDVENVKKRKHAGIMKKALRFINALHVAIVSEYEPPIESERLKILSLRDSKSIEKALTIHAFKLHHERLDMPKIQYREKFSQIPPHNLFEEYVNYRLRRAYHLLQVPPKPIKKA